MRMELAEHYMNPIVEAYDRAADQYSAVIATSAAAPPARTTIGSGAGTGPLAQTVLVADTAVSLEKLNARYRAIFGMASLRRIQWRLEEATATLTAVIEERPATPEWVMPMFLLRRANYRALLNDANAAADAKRVLSDAKMRESKKAAERQLTFIDARRKTDEAAIYAALLPGNRLMIEHRWDEATAVYDAVSAQHPGDWQVKYRRAYLEFARGNFETAGRAFSEIAATSAPLPSWLKAAALLNLGWTQDLAGRRADAIKSYKRVVDEFENEASAGPARVGLISPYRRG
jgi:tetratricopeptide (TPR) repeat protein